MVVYRICKKEELDKIINGIPFSDIGRTCTNDSKLNNHEYKPNIKYLHFYKDYGSIFYLNVTKDHYICTYDIPDEILAEYVGSGRYLDRVFMKKEEQVGEYAIPSSQIDSSYLQRIDKVIDYIDFEDYLYEDYKDNLETIYKKERLKTNVIFLDFDGVLDTVHYKSMEDIERRIKILADICKEYNCKVVIEASAKDAIDEETLEVGEGSWVNDIFRFFKKYGIECIGRTPNVTIKTGENSYISMWKDLEILKYLEMHPEIEHYCVIDDDDTKAMHWEKSDLDRVRDHLVETIYYSDNPEEEGLLPKHKEEVGKILKK
ncbi:MAG: hypothetical protein IJH20_05065 [Bacilli bacterium]|nr:hypothetical protein [Bacilli bacterium]